MLSPRLPRQLMLPGARPLDHRRSQGKRTSLLNQQLHVALFQTSNGVQMTLGNHALLSLSFSLSVGGKGPCLT